MIRKIATVAAIAVATLTISASAYALDFPAAPLNPGPPVLPGEGVIPGVREGMVVVNGVTQPFLQPLLVPAATGAEPAPAVHHRRHHHHAYMHKIKKTK